MNFVSFYVGGRYVLFDFDLLPVGVDRAEKYRSENGPGPAGGPGATSERTGAALPECPQRQKIRFDKSRITYKSE